jgi:hypothetical protein
VSSMRSRYSLSSHFVATIIIICCIVHDRNELTRG